MHARNSAIELLINAHADIKIKNNAGKDFVDIMEGEMCKNLRMVMNIIMKYNEQIISMNMGKK